MTLPLRVTVAPERADAAPGDNLTFDVTVRNASDIVEHYGVEMLGLPDGATVRTEPDVAKLRPAETATLTVRVTLPVQPPAPAGTYVVGALVKSKYRHDVSRCVEVPVALAAVEQITVTAAPEVVTGGRAGRYTIEVANGGNAPVRLYLAATDPERRVSAQFQPAWVDLPPGTSAQALLTVEAPLPWNKEKQRQLSITANPDLPGATANTATATFVQRPRFASKFAKVGGIAAAVAVLAAAIAVPAVIAKTNAKQNQNPAAVNQPNAPSVAAAAAQPTAASSAAASSAAPPPSSAAAAPPPPPASDPASAPASAATDGGGANTVRQVDLTSPPDGVVASDVFRNQGFLVGADPGAASVTGCEDARSAAVVTGPTSKRFLTSSAADNPAKCNTVPLLIDFLADAPAGSVAVTPATPDTLVMEVLYRDLSRSTEPDLAVPADKAKVRGGIDAIELRPKGADPVALTAIKFSALG
jgi:hypothetical protein